MRLHRAFREIVSTETPFDLRVRGTGMETHDGKTVRVIVNSPAGNSFGVAEEQVANGSFDVLFAATSLSYTTVAVYVDSNGDK